MTKLPSSGMQPRDKWIPWYFVLFFAVIFLVDGVIVYLAVTTNPGVVEDHPYEKGLKYNQTIEAFDRQVKLGWKGDVDVKKIANTPKSWMLEVVMVNAEGEALEGASVVAIWSRPVGVEENVRVVCEEKAAGVYQAELVPTHLGQWDVNVMVQKGADKFLLNKRIVLN